MAGLQHTVIMPAIVPSVPVPVPPVPVPVTMEAVSSLYHNTSEDNKKDIVKSQKLFYGTHFCCTLYKGDLPTISPYGDERIVIPIDDVMNLFTRPTLIHHNSYPCGKNMYIEYRLVEGELPPNSAIQNNYVVNDKYLRIGIIDGTLVQEVRQDGNYWVSIIVQKKIDLQQVNSHWAHMPTFVAPE